MPIKSGHPFSAAEAKYQYTKNGRSGVPVDQLCQTAVTHGAASPAPAIRQWLDTARYLRSSRPLTPSGDADQGQITESRTRATGAGPAFVYGSVENRAVRPSTAEITARGKNGTFSFCGKRPVSTSRVGRRGNLPQPMNFASSGASRFFLRPSGGNGLCKFSFVRRLHPGRAHLLPAYFR